MIKAAIVAGFAVAALPTLAAAEPNRVGPACELPGQPVVDPGVLRTEFSPAAEAPKEQVIDMTLSSQQLNAIRVGPKGSTR
ncbi:hypothetical protein AB4Z10_05025 [Bosea sp. RAF48]|uniref:hypothetical protein n=1 Tax=Bosea sp. RAF48 TaxID=3237480 RepID=UPI003F9387E6